MTSSIHLLSNFAIPSKEVLFVDYSVYVAKLIKVTIADFRKFF